MKSEVDLGFSRSPKHSSFVKLTKMDSLTSKMQELKTSRKYMRPNHQYSQAPVKPEVDLDFRGHPNMVAL